jgi:hypothetical protein
MKATVLLGLKVIILAFLLFGLCSIDFLGLVPSASLRTGLVEEAQVAPASLLRVSLLHAAVLSWPILRSHWTGWRLIGAVFLLFYGVTTLMVAIEAVYLPDALSLDLVVRLVVNGGITAAIFSVLAVLIHGQISGSEKAQGSSPQPTIPLNYTQSLPWASYIGRLALLGLSWTVLFVLSGVFVFLPLARCLAPADLATYTSLEMPAWVLPFQALRGMLWSALTLPAIRMMKGRRWETGLAVALLFSVLMGANLLGPTGLPTGLQAAHFVEVLGESFIFGWIVVGLLFRRITRSIPATA